MADIGIQQLPTTAVDDTDIISHITQLINVAFFNAQSALFDEAEKRTNTTEIRSAIGAGEIFVARDVNDHIVGVTQLHFHSKTTASLGMLAVEASQHGKGLGRRIADHVEEESRRRGATTMQVELLVPKDSSLAPAKERLRGWYLLLGFKLVDTSTLGDWGLKELETRLLVPCDFLIYQKSVAA